MIYRIVITNRDPTLEFCKVYQELEGHWGRNSAESKCSRLAKLTRGFGTVYAEDGESIYTADWSYLDAEES